ncbi:metallophosphoesterase family protein, partial [Streptomyces aurantiogriseus]
MRLLHTSDWHLGRAFHRVNMLGAQAEFIGHLCATVREREVDAVVVSGDVYDRAVPPLAAVELFDDALHRLAELGVPTVMISGNHDSARRLGVGAGLIGRAGIHLQTDPSAAGMPVMLADAHGDVAFYGLPYLEPALVKDEFGAEKAGHETVLAAAMHRVRADLATRARGTRSVVLAHAFVTGGEPSDSERDITVGGVASVPAGVFDGVDYVALGHLHGCQTITERVRYSGSPLPYSFSEAEHRKTMWLVDLGADGS